MMLFFKRRAHSGGEAKNRLLSVLHCDRGELSSEKVLGKIRKEVLAVLQKYSADGACAPMVCTSLSGTTCIISADVQLKQAE